MAILTHINFCYYQFMLVQADLNHKRPSFSIKPDFIADSVSEIDFDYLKKLGITTCFIDLDGTVVKRGSFELDKKLKQKLKRSGLDIKIATNRPKSRTLKNLKEELSATGVIHPVGLYGKPTKRYINHGLKEFGLKKQQVIMIGDRYIQDVLGANRSGIYSLIVYKLGDSLGPFDKLISKFEKKLTINFQSKYREI
jgi:HAD superfamily phosphatase (TIGR01668 family)